jgi:hypothetical protein
MVFGLVEQCSDIVFLRTEGEHILSCGRMSVFLVFLWDGKESKKKNIKRGRVRKVPQD